VSGSSIRVARPHVYPLPTLAAPPKPRRHFATPSRQRASLQHTNTHNGSQARSTYAADHPACVLDPIADRPVVDVTTLPVPQLQELKTQLDRELEHLTTSFQSLRTAQAKFRDCLTSIANGLSPSTADKPLLVPLTSSLYVPGRLTDHEHVLVDVGTGYFIEKDIPAAKDFYERKVKDLQDSLKDLEGVVNSKAQNVRVVEEVIRLKVMNAQETKTDGKSG
jgi:prefoldin alpha subunit